MHESGGYDYIRVNIKNLFWKLHCRNPCFTRLESENKLYKCVVHNKHHYHYQQYFTTLHLANLVLIISTTLHTQILMSGTHINRSQIAIAQKPLCTNSHHQYHYVRNRK